MASVTNGRGLILDALHAQADEVDLGGARLTDVFFDYRRQDPSCPAGKRGGLNSSWQGGGNLFFGTTGRQGLGFRAPPADQGIGFCGGSVSHAGGSFTFGLPGPPPPQVFPGLFLNQIRFSLGFDPTRFDGHAIFSVGDVAKIDGALLAVFASGGHPYTLHADARDPLHVFDGQTLLRNRFTDDWHGREAELRRAGEDIGREWREGWTAGDPDRSNTYVGEGVGPIAAIEPAGAVIASMTAEAAALLGRA